ncbi:MAG: toxin-antitoxin system YwqK family antitoxin [Candidatus Binatia bacterium]
MGDSAAALYSGPGETLRRGFLVGGALALAFLPAVLPGCELFHGVVEYVTTPCPFGTKHVVSTDSGTPGLKKLKEKWCEKTDDKGERNRHGPYVEMYESGYRKEIGQYREGRRVGTWMRWYPSNKASSTTVYDDGKPASFTAWHENGEKWEEGRFENGRPHGAWIRWHANGKKEFEGYYDHAAFDRLYTLWHDNGRKEEEGKYEKGVRQGLWIKWHRNGQKRSEILFENGKPDEWYKAWHENGQQAEQALFHHGKPEGIYTLWHDNGQKEEEGTYKDGMLEGAVTAWDREGHVWMKSEYHGGDLVERSGGEAPEGKGSGDFPAPSG